MNINVKYILYFTAFSPYSKGYPYILYEIYNIYMICRLRVFFRLNLKNLELLLYYEEFLIF